MQRILLASVPTLLMCLAPVASAVPAPNVFAAMPWDTFECPAIPTAAVEVGNFIDPSNGLTVTVHALCLAPEAQQAKPGGGGSGSCSSPAYALTGWKWTASWSMSVDPTGSGLAGNNVVSTFGQSASTWSSSLFGSATQNSGGGNAGRSDGVNQIGFKRIGGSTIAQTITWSSGGVAVETDGQYNTNFAWSLSGEANKMDLQNIATHETGHSWGLGHPPTVAENACLTMYAYADYGETQKRTLGTGDSNGFKAIYG